MSSHAWAADHVERRDAMAAAIADTLRSGLSSQTSGVRRSGNFITLDVLGTRYTVVVSIARNQPKEGTDR